MAVTLAGHRGLFTIIGHPFRNRDQVSDLHKYDESGDSNKSSILVPTITPPVRAIMEVDETRSPGEFKPDLDDMEEDKEQQDPNEKLHLGLLSQTWSLKVRISLIN